MSCNNCYTFCSNAPGPLPGCLPPALMVIYKRRKKGQTMWSDPLSMCKNLVSIIFCHSTAYTLIRCRMDMGHWDKSSPKCAS